MAPQTVEKRNSTAIAVLESPQIRARVARRLPEHLTMERFEAIYLTVLRERADLAPGRIDQVSVLSAVVEAAQLGLELDPILGHGYLVPFKGRCVFIPGYRGLIELMRRSGEVARVNAEIVCEGDDIRIDLGSNRQLVHTPRLDIDRTNPEMWVGAYATVAFRDGTTDFDFMTADEIERIRKRSPAGDRGPWLSDTAEMWKKTAVRRIAKRMPLSPRLRSVVEASTRDEYRDAPEYIGNESPTAALDAGEAPDAPAGAPQPKANGHAGPARVAPSAATPEPEPGRESGDEPDGEPIEAESVFDEAPAPDPAMAPVGTGSVAALRRLAEGQKLTDTQLAEILGQHGFTAIEEVTKRAYNAVWNDVAMTRGATHGKPQTAPASRVRR